MNLPELPVVPVSAVLAVSSTVGGPLSAPASELGVAEAIGPIGEDGSARIAERGMTEHVDHPDDRIRRERDRRVLGDLERDQPRQRAVDGSLP